MDDQNTQNPGGVPATTDEAPTSDPSQQPVGGMPGVVQTPPMTPTEPPVAPVNPPVGDPAGVPTEPEAPVEQPVVPGAEQPAGGNGQNQPM